MRGERYNLCKSETRYWLFHGAIRCWSFQVLAMIPSSVKKALGLYYYGRRVLWLNCTSSSLGNFSGTYARFSTLIGQKFHEHRIIIWKWLNGWKFVGEDSEHFMLLTVDWKGSRYFTHHLSTPDNSIELWKWNLLIVQWLNRVSDPVWLFENIPLSCLFYWIMTSEVD